MVDLPVLRVLSVASSAIRRSQGDRLDSLLIAALVCRFVVLLSYCVSVRVCAPSLYAMPIWRTGNL